MLFDSRYVNLNHPSNYHTYSVAADGQRFLIPRIAAIQPHGLRSRWQGGANAGPWCLHVTGLVARYAPASPRSRTHEQIWVVTPAAAKASNSLRTSLTLGDGSRLVP